VRAALTLVVALFAALGGRALVPSAGSAPAEPEPGRVALLRSEIEALRQANRALERALAARASPAPLEARDAIPVSEQEIAEALARWRAAHPAEARAVEERRTAVVAQRTLDELDLENVPMSELVEVLSKIGFGSREHQAIFQRLRESGRIDEYVAAIEALAAENPDDPALQVALGHAYLQKLFGASPSPETGRLAYASDAAFTRALELDETNWDARFSKAVSLANWPAFMGRGPEAIEQFEILRQQQEAQPPRPEFAQTYLFLGNVHQSAGELDQARAAWRAGLALFPDSEALQHALELAEDDQDGRR